MYSDTMRPIDTSSVRLNQSNHASTPSTVAIGVYDGPNSTTQDQNPLSVQDPDTNMASSRMQQCTYRLQGTLGAIASNSQIDAPLDISSGPLSDIIGVGSFDYWPGSNVAFESRNTQLNDFENIFQLMDVSYLLSEQMAEAQTDLMGHFYHPTTNDRAHPEFEPGNLGSN
jgi:hypothetical protein